MTVKELSKLDEDTTLVWQDRGGTMLVYFRGIKSNPYMGKNVRVSQKGGDKRGGFAVPARALSLYAGDFYVNKNEKDVAIFVLVSSKIRAWVTANLKLEMWQPIGQGFGTFAEHAPKYVKQLTDAGFQQGEQIINA
jgi:hypothetical protein